MKGGLATKAVSGMLDVEASDGVRDGGRGACSSALASTKEARDAEEDGTDCLGDFRLSAVLIARAISLGVAGLYTVLPL